MPINRLARLRPGSIHPTAVSLSSGIVVDPDTGILHTKPLKDENIATNARIDNLYWKDPINSTLDLSDNKTPADYRIGEVYFSHFDKNLYIYSGDLALEEHQDFYAPQEWQDNGLSEKFLILSTGISVDNFATKAYVDQEILNLIGGAPETLNTLQELVDALDGDANFAANIAISIGNLESGKADKDSVYTKDEIDDKNNNLRAEIATSIDPFSKPADFVIGQDEYDDSQNLSEFYELNKANFLLNNPANILLKQNSTLDPAGLIIDRPAVYITGLNNESETGNFSLIEKMTVNITENSTIENTIAFSNITFNEVLISNESNPIKIIFENCIFQSKDQGPTAISNQNDEIIFVFKNCKFNSLNTTILFSETTATFYRCSFLSNFNSELFITNSSNVKINNCFFANKLTLLNNSQLYINNCYFETENDDPIITINKNQDVDLPKLFGTKLVFKTPLNYTADHISGTGYCYLDFNCIEITTLPNQVDGSYVRQPTVQDTINDGDGMTLPYFLKPVGYENFFYDDEMAQDAMASAITSATHSAGANFTYDDVNNKLKLNLNLSTAHLSDNLSIAKVDQPNTFLQDNVFQNTTHQRIEANSADITAATISVLNTTTKAPTDNSTHVATTAYVTNAVATLEADFEDLNLHELNDVGINGQVQQGQVLTYSTSPTLTWTNAKISSTDLLDTNNIVRPGDSTFILNGLVQPPRNNQVGNVSPNYQAKNYVAAWNGDHHLNIDGSISTGRYEPVLINEIILPATEQPDNVIDYDGAGKIQIASTEEVESGSVNNKAVVPSYLRSHYLRVNSDNLNDQGKTLLRENLKIKDEFVQLTGENITSDIATDLRTKLKFPTNPTDGYLLKWNQSRYDEYRTSLFNYDYSLLDFNTNGLQRYTAETSSFYDVKTSPNTTSYLDIPSAQSNQGAVIKVRKHNGDLPADAGTLSIMLQQANEYILSADNEKLEVSGQINPQIDLLLEGHTVELIASVDENNVYYWHAFGYYYNAQNQNQPDPPVNIQVEAVEDAIQHLFNHNNHDPSLNIQYNDPEHRLEVTANFATQAQVTAGTINNLPIAPDTLLGVTNVINGTIASLRTYVDDTFLQKTNNLSDLTDAPLARANLQLADSAIVNLGFTQGLIPTVANTFSNGYVTYNGSGLVTQDLPIASTLQDGILTLATFEETALSVEEDKAVTPKALYEALDWDDVRNLLVERIRDLTGTLQYNKLNDLNISLFTGNYYSLSTPNGSIALSLQDISQTVAGNKIVIKFTNKVAANHTLTITPYVELDNNNNIIRQDTIDNDSNPFVLDVEGQAITLVSDGTLNWEII